MLRKVNETKRYIFYSYNNIDWKRHYIYTDQEIRENEKKILETILASFPHATSDKWPDLFMSLNTENIPEKLLILAANVYDAFGNTVLAVACAYGENVEIVQRLINMGADLNKRSQSLGHTSALDRAIANQLSCKNKKSYEAAAVVKCLLDNGARADINCLKYAKKEGFEAAANLIESYMGIYHRGATIGFFKGTFHKDISGRISDFLTNQDGTQIASTRKDAYEAAKMEKTLTDISSMLKKM
jgi:uncharacterized protein